MADTAKVEFPVKFVQLEESRDQAVRSDFPNYTDGLVKSDPYGTILTPRYAEVAEEIYNFPLRQSDTWVLSFPKCGTTWVQEMVWIIANDLDYTTARNTLLDLRFPFLEVSRLSSSEMEEKYEQNPESVPEDLFLTHRHIADMPSPRFIKSHLPLFLLPSQLIDTSKVVYVARNPKDVAVSYYYHHKLISIHHFEKEFPEFVEYFMNNEVLYSPYLEHVIKAWNRRTEPNLLFLFYEDIKKDIKGAIRKVASFFGKSLTDDEIETLGKHLSFDSFVHNSAVNCEHAKKDGFFNQDGRFIRKGVVGDWKNHFTNELSDKFETWVQSQLNGTDLSFVEILEN